MDDSFASKLKRIHCGVREEAAGSTVRYCVLFCGRILYVLFGKTIVARCYYCIRNTLRYFRREDLILWYALYWLAVFKILIKTRFAKVFVKQRTTS
jgi:hypothetical protein